jgi:hypothetical protein
MYKARLLLVTFVMALSTFAMAQTRTSVKINRGWKFIREAVAGAEQPDFDDSGWRTVNLPHDAQIEGSFQKKGDGATSRDDKLTRSSATVSPNAAREDW